MKRKLISGLLAASLALLAFAGCSNGGGAASSAPVSSGTGSSETVSQEAVSSEEASSAPAAITADREGNPITLPEKVDRIISTAASNTEILVGLGVGDKLVVVDKYSAGVEGVPAGIPQVDFRNPDAEAILAAEPDILIASGHNRAGDEDPFALIKEAGVCVVYLPSSTSIEGILGDMEFLAAITGAQEAGRKRIDEYSAEVAKIKAIGDTVTEKKTVYFEIGSGSALYSFGKSTFLNEFIETVGAANILGGEEGWISPSPEAIVAANPDVIITNEDYKGEEQAIADIKGRDGWDVINAVKNDQVYLVNSNQSSRASQNSIEALKAIARAIYPDLYE